MKKCAFLQTTPACLTCIKPVKELVFKMEHRHLNRGLKPTGRIMMLLMLTFFLVLFVITGVGFGVIAHTGISHEQDLLAMVLEFQLGQRTVYSRRGTFLDRDGNVIATQHPSHTMYANFNPDWGTVVEDIDNTAVKLAEIIDMEVDDIIWTLSQENVLQPRFGTAGQRMAFAQRNAIEELELPGIYFVDDLTRFYPKGVFAAHTIGYTMFGEAADSGSSELIGAMGLESYFNGILTGRNGRFQFAQDQFGFRQPGEERLYITYPEDGHDITLTIDSNIQVFLETAMDDMVEQITPDEIVAIVLDARTGEILAAGSRPTFNPNERDPDSYLNAIITPFEPGSTLKMITYAAAINEGNYRGDQVFNSGERRLPGVENPIQDHPLIPRIEMTMDEGFFRSTNTSIIDLFRGSITHTQFLDYLIAFGFGETTGFPSYNEHAGSLPNLDVSLVYGYTAGYGQGVYVTPLQQVQAMTAFLNEGEMLRPQLIAEIYDPNTTTITHRFEREVVGNPITAETANQMRELMIGVVENPIGTGYINYRLNVPSGGKTGTAQVAGAGGYLEGIHIYSYIGFAPAEDPEIIMFIAIKNPTIDNRSGHPYAGEIYRFVMNNTLAYLGLSGLQLSEGDVRPPEIERAEMPRLLNLSTDEAITQIETLGLVPIVIGTGDVVFEQLPTSGTSSVVGDRVFIKTGIEDTLPNFTGWTRAQIHQYGTLLRLDITINGQGGLGARQTIRPGVVVSEGDSLSVTLE